MVPAGQADVWIWLSAGQVRSSSVIDNELCIIYALTHRAGSVLSAVRPPSRVCAQAANGNPI